MNSIMDFLEGLSGRALWGSFISLLLVVVVLAGAFGAIVASPVILVAGFYFGEILSRCV